MNVAELGKSLNLLRVVILKTEGDVMLDRVGEEEVVLGHVCHILSQRLDRNIINVGAVNKHFSVGNIVNSEQNVNYCCLSCARFTDNTHVLACLDSKACVR